MLNNQFRIFGHRPVHIIKLIFGGVMLWNTAIFTMFGWNYRPIDLGEPNSKLAGRRDTMCNDNLRDYQFSFGWRLPSRKLLNEHDFSDETLDLSNESKIARLESVLTISPLEPHYWLMLARLKLLAIAEPDEVLQALRMSYVSGRSERTLMPERFAIATAIWGNLDMSDKIMAMNDLIYGPQQAQDDLSQALSIFTNDELMRLVQMSDMKNKVISEIVRQILEIRRP